MANDRLDPPHQRLISWPCSRWASTRTQFDEAALLGHRSQWWAFMLLFIGFAVKVPRAVAYVAARCTRGSPDADLDDPGRRAAENGGYGIIRICYPICPPRATT